MAPTQPVMMLSPLLAQAAVPHGFSTRRAGVSSGIFSSLNFGNPSELPRDQRDPPRNIARILQILLESVGIDRRDDKEIVQVHQVHGGKAHTVRRGAPAHPGPPDPITGEILDTKADAIVTDDPSRILCVRVADCAPVLLSSDDGRVVAAVHAGWRGVIAGVAPEAVQAMRDLGATGIIAAIGPCISFEQFEVGPEVVAEFRKVFGAAAPCRVTDPSDDHSKGYVDLQAALRHQLVAAGVGQIETIARCTFAEPELFFSHRRDNGLTGRMVGVITPRA